MRTKGNWRNVLINPETTIFTAIKRLDAEGMRVLLVIDDRECLLGIITDGDVRRYLLTQRSLDLSVSVLMNKNAKTVDITENRGQLLAKMQSLGIMHLPVVDKENRVVGLETFDNLLLDSTRDNWVVFMAGGLGKRLHPLTLECPKPLLKIGGKPISEILLNNFIESGFRNFYFSVNYKADMIRNHFGSGLQWGVNIQYVDEMDALGTAGSLSLLPSFPDKPFFVVNTDILTNINFSYLLDFHYEHKAQATICVREFENTIPYGVVQINPKDYSLIVINEKPTQTYFVNAGVYVLDPTVLTHLSFNTYCDMPHFLTKLTGSGSRVTAFPIHEYWLDIGRHDDLEKAVKDYSDFFI